MRSEAGERGTLSHTRILQKTVADRNHVLLLRQGVAVWNQWRMTHATIVPDLSGPDVRSFLYRGSAIPLGYLKWSNLLSLGALLVVVSHTVWQGSWSVGSLVILFGLGQGLFVGLILVTAIVPLEVVLWACALAIYLLAGQSPREKQLHRINLSWANLWATDLRNADLRQANLKGADLRLANLHGADLRGANLERANLTGTNLKEARLQGANLTDATLIWANLDRTDFRGAILCNSKLWMSHRLQTRFSQAVMPNGKRHP